MKVQDITFKQYVALQDRTLYDYYLEFGKFAAEDVFKVGPFVDLPFGFVKDIQYHIVYSKDGLTWYLFFEEISKLKQVKLIDLADYSIFSIHKAVLYFRDQVGVINDMESNYLGHAATAEERQAGIDRFSSYGPFLQYDRLAGGDLLKFEEIKKLPYSVCFTKLKLDADNAEYQQAYNEILKNKNT